MHNCAEINAKVIQCKTIIDAIVSNGLTAINFDFFGYYKIAKIHLVTNFDLQTTSRRVYSRVEIASDRTSHRTQGYWGRLLFARNRIFIRTSPGWPGRKYTRRRVVLFAMWRLLAISLFRIFRNKCATALSQIKNEFLKILYLENGELYI